MKKSRFTDEQIAATLRESETGTTKAELSRKHGISNNTLYNWRAKFGGMQSANVKRLRPLEEENMQMKKLLGEQALLIDGYKIALSKKY
jgi:putative transposase